MAIIYSYPIVTPTSNDLLLGTDVDAQGKPTKNFTVQSIVDIVQGGAAGLGAVLTINNSAKNTAGANQSAIDFLNIQGTGTSTFSTFSDGTMNISGGIGTAFTSITSTDFAGNLTGIVKAGSSIEGTVTGVTQAAGDNSTKLATTAYVDGKVDPSVLQYLGDATGPFDLNLVNDDFKIAGTANQIETTATTVAANIGTITLSFPTAGVTLPDGSVATTQAAADNTTKVATDAFVQQENNAQDLDFTGDTGTSSVLLNSQTLDFEGTANQITTAVTAQKVKFTLPTDVTITGTFTGATFAGDLLGTINTATTGTTQTAGDDSTKIATTAYVDAAAGAKTLDYAGDATGPFSLNLTDDDLEFNGDSNITVTAAAVAANKGIVTIDLNNDVTISGTMQAGTLSDGTFSGSAGTYTGGVSITSTAFVGALTGNASTATALAVAGTVGVTGDVSTVPAAPTYTGGGNILIDTTISDTVVTGKVLTNLPTPTSGAITASDTILAAMAKLQGQITSTTGLSYEGTWDARNSAEGGSSDGGNPDLTQASTKVNGHFYIVNTPGNAEPNGGSGTQLSPWANGDWVIYVASSGTTEWQKLDQSNEVLGSGTAQKMAMWSGTVGDASQTLATGLIEQNAANNLITIGNSGSLLVQGNTTLGDATTDTTTIVGPVEMQETARFNVGISLGAATYGTAGQVLTSGGSSASVNTWTTPTTGTVEEVDSGDGLITTPTAGITSTGSIAIDYLGTDNAILSATDLGTGTIATTDQIWFNDVAVGSDPTTNTLSYAPVSKLPFDNFSSWTLAGDSGTQTISSGNTAKIAGGTGVTTEAVSTDTVNVTLRYEDVNANPSTGALNFIDASGAAVAPHEDDYLIFSNQESTSVKNSVKRATIADIVDLGNENLTQVLANGNNSGGTDSINMTGATSSILLPDSGTAAVPAIDQGRIKFGGSADFQIYHNGTHAYLANTTGGLIMSGETNVNIGFSTGENAITAIKDGATSIKYNNLDRVVTSSAGITVTGDQTLNGGKYIGYDSSGSQIQLSRDNTPTIAGHNLGTINFGGENFTSGSNINTASLVAEAEGAWSATNNDTKLTMFLMNGTTSRWVLQAKSNREVDFAGDVDIAGNLTVDGNIINGKGGNYIGDGSFTDGAAAAKLFDIQRANSGALVFDLMLTVGASSTRSIAKKFTVVHAYGATPIFVKTLDTGPDAGIDFDVTFVASTNTGLQCKIAASGADLDVYYSIIAGHAPFSITIS